MKDTMAIIKVSIVVPVYNVENVLQDCLTCLTEQTLQEIEIICVDDASTDNSNTILRDFAAKDMRISVISHSQNLSASVARKEGALAAKGEYTLFVDPDDTLEKNAAEVLYETATRTNVDILHFGTNVINCGVTDKQVQWYVNFSKPYTDFLYGEDVFTRCFDTQEYRFNIWNKLIRTSVCQKAMSFCTDEPLPKAQDLYAYFLIAYFADSYYGISEPFYNYAFGGGISGGRDFTEEKFRRHCSQANVAYYIIEFLLKNNCLEHHYHAAFRIINNLINDNIASLQACGKAKKTFSAEKIFADAWINGNLQEKLLLYIQTQKDFFCAKLLFEINFKLLKNLSIKSRRLIFERIALILELYPCVYDEILASFDIQSKDYMFMQTIAAAQRANKYRGRHIPVFMATNSNYAPFLSVTLNSLMQNADRYYFYDIIIFHSGIENYYIKKLDNETKTGFSVRCVNVKSIISSQNLYANRHYSMEMYYRFLIPELFFFLPKAVYIDCDTIVLDSIHKLYNIDIGNSVLGAARNLLHREMYGYVVDTLHLDPDKYFNSGVLIINCERFLSEGIKNKCYAYLRDHFDLACPDQDALNKCCESITLIDAKWNFQWHHLLNFENKRYSLVPNDAAIFDKSRNDIRLLHFTSNKKPWNYFASEFSDLFFLYAKNSLFFTEILVKCQDSNSLIDNKIKDLYVKIGKLNEKLNLLTNSNNDSRKFSHKKSSPLHRLLNYWRKYGLRCTLVRIFKGRNQAAVYYEAHQNQKEEKNKNAERR